LARSITSFSTVSVSFVVMIRVYFIEIRIICVSHHPKIIQGAISLDLLISSILTSRSSSLIM